LQRVKVLLEMGNHGSDDGFNLLFVGIASCTGGRSGKYLAKRRASFI